MTSITVLAVTINELLPTGSIINCVTAHNELTITIESGSLIESMQILKNNTNLQFAQCMDLCGVDYSHYHNDVCQLRFAVVYHLLSLHYNVRLRVRVFAQDNNQPALPSVVKIWVVANWFEREVFDLFGIIFTDHPDLRRILTDYGFIGHPLRKDFPLSGHVEIYYDEQAKQVKYQPVSIPEREVIPRIIREDSYAS